MTLSETQRYPSYWSTCGNSDSPHWEKEVLTASSPSMTEQKKCGSRLPRSSDGFKQTQLNFSPTVEERHNKSTTSHSGTVDFLSESNKVTKFDEVPAASFQTKLDDNIQVVAKLGEAVTSTTKSSRGRKKTTELANLEGISIKPVQKTTRYQSADTRPKTNATARQKLSNKAASVSPKKERRVEDGQCVVDSDASRRKKHQTQLTAYGIRRTARQFMKDKEREREASVFRLLHNQVETGMKVIVTEDKGRGVVATRVFENGEFVVEYAGDLITERMAKEREKEYKRDPSIGSYMFYFVHSGQKWCVDATKETPRFGRLINHSRLHPNCVVKVIPLDGVPRLVLFAKQVINPGEELLYDYGDRDKESLEAHPWLKF
ncbi:unnamed protein product [Dicrocoelium dendriticum]|nr:unnamed protein product [Dicrocoelium dendriticum]